MEDARAVLKRTSHRFVQAQKNAIANCTQGCEEPCKDCTIVELDKLKALEQSQPTDAEKLKDLEA